MTDTAREAPKMTFEHRRALLSVKAYVPEDVRGAWDEVETLVRSLSTGEADTYDPRSEVKVSREEISEVMLALRKLANYTTTPHHAATLEDLRDRLAGWLSESTPAAASTKEEKS